MWSKPMLRVEMYATPTSCNARSVGAEISDLCPTLTQRLAGTATALAGDTAQLVIVGTIPHRGLERAERLGLVLLAAVDGEPETAHAAEAAGSLVTTPPVSSERCCPDVCGSRYGGDMTPVDGVAAPLARSPSVSRPGAVDARLPDVGSPPTMYTKSGDLHIAYQVVGDGPGDLIYVPSAFGHVEIFWENPEVEHFLRGLASFSRMIVFDKRGTGMSDRPSSAPTLTERADDIRAVMDAVGSQRAALYGMSDGGVIAAKFAALHPQRVTHFIAMGSGPGTYVPPQIAEQIIADVVRHWGNGEIIDKGAPSVAHVPWIRAYTARLQQHSVSPGAMADLIRMNTTYDVRPDLPAVTAPTLVLHRTGDLLYNIREGRDLAARIAGARFVELPGTDHLPYYEDADVILDLIEEFVTGRPPGARRRQPTGPPAALTTRECAVLRLVALGRTNQQIGDDLFISPHTVSHHLRSIFAKTATANRTEASAFAHRHALL